MEWSMSLGSLAPLPGDPLPDVSRATQQLDAVPFVRGEEAHHCEIHECRLRQVEHEPGTVPLHPRLQLDQVILLDAPTEPERRRLSVTDDFDLQSHRCGRKASAAPRLTAYEIASWFCGSCQPVGYCQAVGAPAEVALHRSIEVQPYPIRLVNW